ncbi:AraC family transcriptional regulator [Actinocorallia longicatena]|uniref:Helix-turn-helix domain-containing protein n=1 Tax=Actinocorallia longicatena TaxID=111803 RepID=A0ABP6PXU9_9ACTN
MNPNTRHDHQMPYAGSPQTTQVESPPLRVSDLNVSRFARSGSDLHLHERFEIVLITGGTGLHRTMTGYRRVGRGHVLLLRPGMWHSYEECRDLAGLTCEAAPGLFDKELAWILEDPLLGLLFTESVQTPNFIELSDNDLSPATIHLQELRELQRHSPVSHRADLFGRFLLLASCIAQAGATREAALSIDVPDHPAVLTAIEMFNNDLSYDWTLAELAGALHLTQGHIVRLFKSGVGIPPMAYLFRQRAKKAAHLLKSTDAGVAEIGHAVGWTDPNYFTRRFRTYFGMSPTRYRESQIS